MNQPPMYAVVAPFLAETRRVLPKPKFVDGQTRLKTLADSYVIALFWAGGKWYAFTDTPLDARQPIEYYLVDEDGNVNGTVTAYR